MSYRRRVHRHGKRKDRWSISHCCETPNGMCHRKSRRVSFFLKDLATCLSWRLIRDYVPLVNLTGVFFQIRDDYMNLQDSEVHISCWGDSWNWIQFSLVVWSQQRFCRWYFRGKILVSDHPWRSQQPFWHPDTECVITMSSSPHINLEGYSLFTDVLRKRPTSPTLKTHIIEYLGCHTRSFQYTCKHIYLKKCRSFSLKLKQTRSSRV